MESQEAASAQTQLELNKLKSELEGKQDLIFELEERISLAPSERDLSALKESLSISEEAAADLQKAKQDLASLEDQLKASQQDARELQESKETILTQLKIAESSSLKKDSEIESLQNKVSEQAALASVAANQKTEILSLKESLSSFTDSRESGQRNLETSRKQLTEAQKAIEKVNAEANATNELLRKAERETQQLEEENTSLKQVVSKQREDSDRVRAQQQEVSKRTAELENQLKQYKSQMEEMEEQGSGLEDQKVKLEEVLEENVILSRKAAGLEQEIISAKKERSGLLEEKVAQAKLLTDKNDTLIKQVGQLEASVKHSDSAAEELKEIVEAQKSKIRELEQSAVASSGLAGRQSEAAEQSRMALLNIEETLKRQMDRMNSLEKINEQSLAKISELQSAPTSRKTSRKKLPDGHEDLSEINGVGPKFRQSLFDHGVRTIQEIASWSTEDAKSFAEKLGCGERTTMQWVEKAAEIVHRKKIHRLD